MIEENIHKAAQEFADAVKKTTKTKYGVGIYYVYEFDGNWYAGYAGDMSSIEGLGAVEYIRDYERKSFLRGFNNKLND